MRDALPTGTYRRRPLLHDLQSRVLRHVFASRLSVRLSPGEALVLATFRRAHRLVSLYERLAGRPQRVDRAESAREILVRRTAFVSGVLDAAGGTLDRDPDRARLAAEIESYLGAGDDLAPLHEIRLALLRGTPAGLDAGLQATPPEPRQRLAAAAGQLFGETLALLLMEYHSELRRRPPGRPSAALDRALLETVARCARSHARCLVDDLVTAGATARTSADGNARRSASASLQRVPGG